MLHTDNGTEFNNLASRGELNDERNLDLDGGIDELKQLWSDCMTVKGRLRHSPSQGSVERANRKFRENIRVWLYNNRKSECKNAWPLAALFSKWNINNCLLHGLREIPFKPVYGQNPICGINGLPILSNDMALRLRTERHIAEFYGHQPEFNLESITYDGGKVNENRLNTQEKSDEQEAPLLDSNVLSNTITTQVNAMNVSYGGENSSLPFSHGINETDADVNPVLQSRKDNRHDFSRREALQRSAYNKMVKQGARMQKQAARSQGQLLDLVVDTICLFNMMNMIV